MSAKPLRVLLVEDNPGDVRLTREGFRDSAVRGTLDVVKDGVDAIEYLRNAATGADEAHGDDSPPGAAARPDLVLLDLNLPRKDGRQVLAEVKSHPRLKCIPVVVLSTSSSERDVATSYGLHANAYVTKPSDLDEFIAAIKHIGDFWSTTATPPLGSSAA